MASSEALFRDTADRLGAIAQIGSVSLLHHQASKEVGLVAKLAFPKTGEPSAETLVIQMAQGDAWAFAQLVLTIAKDQGWNFGMDAPYDAFPRLFFAAFSAQEPPPSAPRH